MVTGRPPNNAEIRAALALFKAAAQNHMLNIAMAVVRARPGIINDILKEVHIVVSTCDAWCKWRPGGIKGNMGKALGQRTPVIYVMDEMEGYSVDQVLAATAGETFDTLVMIGDVHQRELQESKVPPGALDFERPR